MANAQRASDHFTVTARRESTPRATPIKIGLLGKPLDSEDIETLREIIAEKGAREASRLLGVPRPTLTGAASGTGLREGTRLLITTKLHAYRAR